MTRAYRDIYKKLLSKPLMFDISIVLFLVLVTLLYAYLFINFQSVSQEDAAMLMRYAEHFAQGFGIVWNIGEEPVDGATDFLFLIVTSLLVKLGLPVELSAQAIGLSSHILTVVIIYVAIRSLYDANVLAALVSALYLAVGPGLHYIAGFFGTPFFALFACIAWWMAMRLIVKKSNPPITSLLFALSGLVMGLIRPEGVILAGFMLLAIVYFNGLKQSRTTIIYFLGIFAVFGGLYFFWRWYYFGYPLPNPFYKKGGGALYPRSMLISARNAIILSLPFLPAFLLGFRSPTTSRIVIASLIPIVGFTTSFVLLSNEMNYGARFQYAVLPIVLISWFPLVKGISRDLHLPKWGNLEIHQRVALTSLAIVLLIGTIFYYPYTQGQSLQRISDGRYDVARILSEYSDKGYTIATTEAGSLPLYSRWRAIDTWGLNDKWIAHNGGITTEYLDRYKPQIIMLRTGAPAEYGEPWTEMETTLQDYAENNGYTLAAVFTWPETKYPDGHYYYVRSDFPESEEIISKIHNINYSGQVNYLAVES